MPRLLRTFWGWVTQNIPSALALSNHSRNTWLQSTNHMNLQICRAREHQFPILLTQQSFGSISSPAKQTWTFQEVYRKTHRVVASDCNQSLCNGTTPLRMVSSNGLIPPNSDASRKRSYSVQPFKRSGSVSHTISHLRGIVSYRMDFSHETLIPSRTTAVT